METEKIPSGNSVAPALDPPPAQDPVAADLRSMVAESRAENLAAEPAAPKPKRTGKHKGGRPRKDGKPRKSDLAALGLSDPPAGNGSTTSADPAAQPPAPGDAGALSAIEFKPEMLAKCIQLPFNLARSKTGFQGFGINDDEALSYAPLLDEVIKTYLPAMETKHAAAISLGLALGMTGYSQFLAYLDWKRTGKAPTPTPQSSEPTAPPVSASGIRAAAVAH